MYTQAHIHTYTYIYIYTHALRFDRTTRFERRIDWMKQVTVKVGLRFVTRPWILCLVSRTNAETGNATGRLARRG